MKSNSTNADAYSILMEFIEDNRVMADKIINELNIANDEKSGEIR